MTTTTRWWNRSIAAVSVGAISLLLAGCALFGGGDAGSTPTPTPTPTPTATDTDVFKIKVGDCLDSGGTDGEIFTVATVDCATAHEREAYASITMAVGDFPGDDAVRAEAVTDCTTKFDSFVGVNYDKSTLNFSYYFPTAKSWVKGDHEILCLILDPAGRSKGTLAGSAK